MTPTKNIQPIIKSISPKLLVGMGLTTNLLENRIAELWQGFGPKQKHIRHQVSNDRISMVIYDETYFTAFDPKNRFERWACVEVEKTEDLPNGLSEFELPGGMYAVFDYKGLSSDNRIFQYIFNEWLPKSKYQIDTRPHFELLGDKYKNNDPNSEEEIWIPVKPRA